MIEWNTMTDAKVVVLTGPDRAETTLYQNGLFDGLAALLASMPPAPPEVQAVIDEDARRCALEFAAIRSEMDAWRCRL